MNILIILSMLYIYNFLPFIFIINIWPIKIYFLTFSDPIANSFSLFYIYISDIFLRLFL